MFRTPLLISHVLLCAMATLCQPALAAAPVAPVAPAGNATTLLAKHAEFQPQLQAKALGEPAHLVSQDSGSRLEADIYAELQVPFAQLSGLLSATDSLCGVMFLHQNVRGCQPQRGAAGDALVLTAGPKQAVTGGSIYTMNYTMHVESATPEYLRVSLAAVSGPLSTSDYRIVFEATPLDGQRSFLHFGYGYRYGTMARMALGFYLATAGRNKIGFSVVGKESVARSSAMWCATTWRCWPTPLSRAAPGNRNWMPACGGGLRCRSGMRHSCTK